MGTLAARQRLGARSYAGEHPARSRPSASLGAASVPPAACSPVIALGGAKGELNARKLEGFGYFRAGNLHSVNTIPYKLRAIRAVRTFFHSILSMTVQPKRS
jgi:hypothetical protein